MNTKHLTSILFLCFIFLKPSLVIGNVESIRPDSYEGPAVFEPEHYNYNVGTQKYCDAQELQPLIKSSEVSNFLEVVGNYLDFTTNIIVERDGVTLSKSQVDIQKIRAYGGLENFLFPDRVRRFIGSLLISIHTHDAPAGIYKVRLQRRGGGWGHGFLIKILLA
jgi:hypothetical protein